MGREVLYSLTLADIYLKQGLKNKALEIYEYLLFKHPENEELKKRVDKLREELEGKSVLTRIKEAMKKNVW